MCRECVYVFFGGGGATVGCIGDLRRVGAAGLRCVAAALPTCFVLLVAVSASLHVVEWIAVPHEGVTASQWLL